MLVRIWGFVLYVVFGWGLRFVPFLFAFGAGLAVGGDPLMDSLWRFVYGPLLGGFVVLCAVGFLGLIVGFDTLRERRVMSRVFAILIAVTYSTAVYLSHHNPSLRF